MRQSRIKRNDNRFFDKTKNLVLFFIILGIVSVSLTILTVTIRFHFGENINIPNTDLYWNTNVFLTFVIGFVVTPFVILIIVEKRNKIFNF